MNAGSWRSLFEGVDNMYSLSRIKTPSILTLSATIILVFLSSCGSVPNSDVTEHIVGNEILESDITTMPADESENQENMESDTNYDSSSSETNNGLSEVVFNIPKDFIDCQEYIGKDISTALDVDKQYLESMRNPYTVGTSSLYGNKGNVSIWVGWDGKTITDITLVLETGEYIQGEEYEEICNKLKIIFGEETVIADGVTNFSGIGYCDFRLNRNGAGIGMNEYDREKYEVLNPDNIEQEPDVAIEPKVPPSIGMTEAQVLASTWGEPSDINRTTTRYGVWEQWVYRTGAKTKYIYLDNGIVTAIQE